MPYLHPPIDIDGLPDPALVRAVLQRPTERRLAPWFYSRCHGNETKIPPDLLKELRQSYLLTLRQNIFLHKELNRLLKLFHEAGIPAMPLKGTSLGLRLYGDLGLRPCADLDILVKDEKLPQAQRLLQQAGYQKNVKQTADYHITYQQGSNRTKPIYVDLHRNLHLVLTKDMFKRHVVTIAQAFTNAVWQRAILSQENEFDFWKMTPVDELIFLCLHLVHHLRMERWNHPADSQISKHKLLLALDIHIALKQWQQEIDWQLFQRSISQFNLNDHISLAFAYAQYWYSTFIPEQISWNSGVPEWKKTYFFGWKQSQRHFETLVKNLPVRLQIMLDFMVLYRSWHDRIEILWLSIWYLSRKFHR
ncbi:MAG: nucleotidyltransferase family protein [Chloroflexi bacterium]|nr:nucleotidyltransferase family protein [Chloroflexota bacterium]